jgi:hypothetical protein
MQANRHRKCDHPLFKPERINAVTLTVQEDIIELAALILNSYPYTAVPVQEDVNGQH